MGKGKKRFPNIFFPSHILGHVCFILESEEKVQIFKLRQTLELASRVGRPCAFWADWVEGEKCAIGEREKGEMLQQDTNKGS